jgi:IclR family transcriptional regulator, acetate operon repressor
MRRSYPIESVDRALTLLLAYQDTEAISVTEAGERLGVSRSTAYRLLNALAQHDFVRQDKRTKAYHGGPALLRLGLAAAHRSDIRSELRGLLESVVAEIDETTHLVVLQGAAAFYLDCVEATRMVRATSRVAQALPAHCTAAGKALLASLSEPELDILLRGQLVGLTRRSKVSAARVRRELDRVRSQGFAINDEESEIGLRAVAVRVPSSATGGEVDAAITVSGPSQRFDARRMSEIAAILTARIEALENY